LWVGGWYRDSHVGFDFCGGEGSYSLGEAGGSVYCQEVWKRSDGGEVLS